MKWSGQCGLLVNLVSVDRPPIYRNRYVVGADAFVMIMDQPSHDINDAVSPARLTLWNLLEIVFAFSVIAAADGIAHWLLGLNVGWLIFLGCFYPLKLSIAIAGKKRRLLSTIAYVSWSALAMIWPVSQEWNNDHITWVGFFICMPLMFLTIPSITFIFDLSRPHQLTIRRLIWRSLVEIALIFPPWAIAIFWAGFFVGGWWI